MIRNKTTNEFFESRQVAKKVMGHSNFNKAVKEHTLEWGVEAPIDAHIYSACDIII